MQLEEKKSYINVNGVDHYYEWIKTPEESGIAKPVMVFIHGWGGSGRYWESTARALSDKFDCLIYDLRGFGRTPLSPELKSPEERYELTGYAQDLAGLLESLHLDKIYLNAHSLGGSIAVLFLNLYPEKVERAILTCSGIFEYDEKSFNTFHQFSRYVVAFRPQWLAQIPFANKLFMARFLHKDLPGEISQAFLEDFLLADFDAAYGTVLTSVSKEATEWLPREFEKLTVPTLLVSGERDIIIPAKMGEMAANSNDKIEYAMMKDTAHFPMLEDAETYLKVVREFLK
ncbi:MAG: alpha/beta hydrolase [Cyanobacteriota bacterium]|nr:alpha/beta hydrolase [Cyanobacteriota bacterium]